MCWIAQLCHNYSMTVKPADIPEPKSGLWLASDVTQAVFRLLSGIQAIPSVQKLAYSSDGAQLDLWVFTRDENLQDSREIHLLERELRQRASSLPLNVNLIPLSEIEAANLPPAETLFER